MWNAFVLLWQRVRSWWSPISLAWNSGANQRSFALLMVFCVPVIVAYLLLVRAPHAFPLNELVAIEEKSSLTSIAESLEEQHVVRSAEALTIVVRLMGGAEKVHAGDYMFKRPEDVFTLAQRIIDGRFGLEPVRIRIPEGSTAKQMAPLFAKALPRFDEEHFLEIATPQEGKLFPDTYFFLPNAREEEVVRTLTENFDTKIAPLKEKIEAFGKPLEEVIIMASLLELEASRFNDRRMISGVLWNRINKGMMLQVDAAFLYFLGRTTYTLSLEDLKHESPYNTYKYKGLPPGPIANPSVASIEAAVTPVEHKYIFYLADYSGNTYYSRTYAEHLEKKRIYIDR
jgi:UPF0755 protein